MTATVIRIEIVYNAELTDKIKKRQILIIRGSDCTELKSV